MNHRQRLDAHNIKHGPPPEYDDKVMELLACIRSRQVEADQLVAHVAAGDAPVKLFTTKWGDV